MLIRSCDFSFTFAAILSIICTDGWVAGTTSLQRIVTCCASAAAIAPNANHTNVKKRFIDGLLEKDTHACGFALPPKASNSGLGPAPAALIIRVGGTS